MPDPSNYSDRDEFVSDCVSARQSENPDESVDQSVAACSSIWDNKSASAERRARTSPAGMQHKAAELIEVSEDEAVFVASTEAPDRYGDVVRQNWELRNYQKNPVLLFQHNSSALPIGKVAKFWTEGSKSFARAVRLPEGMDETADKVWKFIKGGFLNAVSVGFIPLEDPRPRQSKDGSFLGWEFPRSELLELSVVSVPANQEALAVARSLHLSSHDLQQIFSDPGAKASGHAAKARRFAEIHRLRSGG